MARKRRDLFGEIASVHAEMQHMLEDMLRPPGRRPLVPGRGWQPATDVYRTPGHVVVRIEIAGISREDIDIQFAQGHMLIRGFRIEDPDESKESIQQMEIGYGNFERVVHIAEPVDPSGVEAEYKDGFLVVRVPLKEKRGSRDIEIK